MSDPNQPKRTVVDGVAYDYKRRLLEILECQTCGAVFETHIPSGVGRLSTPEFDTKLCPGCEEMCQSVVVDADGGAN